MGANPCAYRKLLIGLGSRRRSASQAIDLPSGEGVTLGRLFTLDFAQRRKILGHLSRKLGLPSVHGCFLVLAAIPHRDLAISAVLRSGRHLPFQNFDDLFAEAGLVDVSPLAIKR